MRRHAALIAITLTACAQAWSATDVADTLSHALDEVVVQAQASRSAASAAPLRVASREGMLRTGVTDVSDALHRMPGVNLRDYGGAGGLKTVSVRGFGSAHTGVFYDGVPLSDVQSGQIDLSRYSIDNVNSVSMVVGDNDDIFIPARLAASAATVSISTLPVIDRLDLNAKMRVGSFGYYNPFLRVGTPIGENFAINFVGEYMHADNDYPFKLVNGQTVTKEKRANSRMDSGHGEINFLAHLGGSDITAKAYYYNSYRHLPGPVIYYNNESNERLREHNAMGQAQLRTRVGEKVSISAIAKCNFAASLYRDANGKYPGGVLIQDYWQREYYVSCAVLYAPAEGWLLDYSADYFYNNLNSNLASNRRPFRNSFLQSATAKYKSGRLTVMARLLASAYFNGAKDGRAASDAKRLSPSLCVSYQPLSSQLLFARASYKNIFRMPTFNEAYFDHYGSEDVLPESTDQINIGATYTFKSSSRISYATFSVDGYVNNIRDMIVAMPYNMFVWRIVNLGKVRAYGLDVTGEASYSPSAGHNVLVAASYGLQRAMPRTSRESKDWMKQVAYIPKHSGSVTISYENPWANLSLTGTGVPDLYTTNENLPATKIAGYVEFGASAWRSFQMRGHELEIRTDVQNLLDKQYSIVARYPMPGRQFKFTLTFNY